MGHVIFRCAESGVPLVGKTRLVLTCAGGAGAFIPAALPLVGNYDGDGGVRVVAPSRQDGALVRFLESLTPKGEMWRGLWSLRQEGRPFVWRGSILSYALFDEGIARAMTPAASASNGAMGTLAAASETWLAIYGSESPTTTEEQLRWLGLVMSRPDLAHPRWGQSGGTQYTGAAGWKRIQQHMEEARARYVGRPGMLAAVDEMEAHWSEVVDLGFRAS